MSEQRHLGKIDSAIFKTQEAEYEKQKAVKKRKARVGL